MRRDSAFIFLASAVISVAIVGGVYYMGVIKPMHSQVPVGKGDIAGVEEQRMASGAISDGPPAATGSYNDQIIRCERPDGTLAYTNAANCSQADWDNRLSHAKDIRPTPAYPNSTVAEAARKSEKKSNRREPDIRQVARTVPSNLTPGCRFSVGRALEIERVMSEADKPHESRWRENYCRQVKDSTDCGLPSSFFYYGCLCDPRLNC